MNVTTHWTAWLDHAISPLLQYFPHRKCHCLLHRKESRWAENEADPARWVTHTDERTSRKRSQFNCLGGFGSTHNSSIHVITQCLNSLLQSRFPDDPLSGWRKEKPSAPLGWQKHNYNRCCKNRQWRYYCRNDKIIYDDKCLIRV